MRQSKYTDTLKKFAKGPPLKSSLERDVAQFELDLAFQQVVLEQQEIIIIQNKKMLNNQEHILRNHIYYIAMLTIILVAIIFIGVTQ